MENKSMVAGILSIVSGAFGVLSLGSSIFMVYMFNTMLQWGMPYSPGSPEAFMVVMTVFYVGIGVFMTLLGVLAIVGGVFSLKKKRWPLALAGTIAGTITFFPCGIPAIVLVSMAKQTEFNESKPSV